MDFIQKSKYLIYTGTRLLTLIKNETNKKYGNQSQEIGNI